MLADLKFVQGAVAKKDFLPALTHFVIENGTVRGYNGTIALCSPIPFDIACKPKAEPLVRAIGNCNETVQLSLTPAGRLSVRSGAFRAHVECVQGDTPHTMPGGTLLEINGAPLLAGLKAAAPFVGSDASRKWSNGVLLSGPSMFATNNVTLVEYWMGEIMLPHEVCVPQVAIKEMLRINEVPVSVQYEENSLTFHYTGGRWLRTQLLEATKWPDLARVLDVPSTPVKLEEALFEGLATIKPFADKLERVLVGEGTLRTHETEGEGAAYAVDAMQHDGVYNISMLQLLDGIAHSADFTLYPRPCAFFGDNLRGMLIGMRK